MTVSKELKEKIPLWAWGSYDCVKRMRNILDPNGHNRDANQVVERAKDLYHNIKDLLEIEEVTVSQELKREIRRKAWALFDGCVVEMRRTLDPHQGDEDASRIVQEARELLNSIIDLLEKI
jgi:hypothetical protein